MRRPKFLKNKSTILAVALINCLSFLLAYFGKSYAALSVFSHLNIMLISGISLVWIIKFLKQNRANIGLISATKGQSYRSLQLHVAFFLISAYVSEGVMVLLGHSWPQWSIWNGSSVGLYGVINAAMIIGTIVLSVALMLLALGTECGMMNSHTMAQVGASVKAIAGPVSETVQEYGFALDLSQYNDTVETYIKTEGEKNEINYKLVTDAWLVTRVKELWAVNG